MRKKITILIALILITFGFSESCFADELSELKTQFEAIRNEVQAQTEQMEEMQNKIQAQTEAMEVMSREIESLEKQKTVKIEAAEGELRPVEFRLNDSTRLKVGTLLRSYYINDQRINWSGQEATFAVEGVFSPWVESEGDWGRMKVGGDFFLNQRFGRNLLRHNNILDTYSENFQVDTFEIDRLSIELEKWGFTLRAGKVATPFGRYYFPLFTNARSIGPFIRTESINWRESGVFLTYKYNYLVLDLGHVNGEAQKDTNSDKANMGRLGFEGKNWAIGISGKLQDGIGSGGQKEYNNHAGADIMIRLHPALILSGEVIYDEYGFRNDFNINNIDWPRSLYYRDIYYSRNEPLDGIGAYLNLGYRDGGWLIDFNYGEYHPDKVGISHNDLIRKRGLLNIAYDSDFLPGFRLFSAVMVENDIKDSELEALARQGQKGFAATAGAQYKF
ncbi:coiled-coil domain-containing protein [Candidatus Omnitrophota bacterium]